MEEKSKDTHTALLHSRGEQPNLLFMNSGSLYCTVSYLLSHLSFLSTKVTHQVHVSIQSFWSIIYFKCFYIVSTSVAPNLSQIIECRFVNTSFSSNFVVPYFMVMIYEVCKSPASFHAHCNQCSIWFSSANISLSLWKIIQCRRVLPAFFGSTLLDTMWRDGSFI